MEPLRALDPLLFMGAHPEMGDLFLVFRLASPTLLRCNTRLTCATSTWYSNDRHRRRGLLHYTTSHLLAPGQSCERRGITGQHRTSGEHETPSKSLRWTPPIRHSRYPMGHGGGGDQSGWLTCFDWDNFGGRAALHTHTYTGSSSASILETVWDLSSSLAKVECPPRWPTSMLPCLSIASVFLIHCGEDWFMWLHS